MNESQQQLTGQGRWLGDLGRAYVMVAIMPGSPQMWSPCRCVMKILSKVDGLSGEYISWCCVPSPQSIIHDLANMRSTMLVTLRLLDGEPDDVPCSSPHTPPCPTPRPRCLSPPQPTSAHLSPPSPALLLCCC